MLENENKIVIKEKVENILKEVRELQALMPEVSVSYFKDTIYQQTYVKIKIPLDD